MARRGLFRRYIFCVPAFGEVRTAQELLPAMLSCLKPPLCRERRKYGSYRYLRYAVIWIPFWYFPQGIWYTMDKGAEEGEAFSKNAFRTCSHNQGARVLPLQGIGAEGQAMFLGCGCGSDGQDRRGGCAGAHFPKADRKTEKECYL